MANPRAATISRIVTETLRALAGPFAAQLPTTKDELLRFDPNSLDLDPVPFYEVLSERFGVGFEDDAGDFGGFGGSLAETIAFLDERWDGELREVDLPPPDEEASPPRGSATAPAPWQGPDEVVHYDPDPAALATMQRAISALAADDLDTGCELLTRCIAAADLYAHPDALGWATQLVSAARLLAGQDRTHEFGTCAELVLRIRTTQLPPDALDVALAWRIHGAFWLACGRRSTARADLEKALAIQTAALGADHTETVKTRTLIAHVSDEEDA